MSQPPPIPAPTRKPTPLARGFSCKSCGAPVKVLTGGVALSAVCGHCGTAVDLTDGNLRVLAQWSAAMVKVKPIIPLGSRGMLKGILWQCIGFMRRCEQGSGWAWEEHLLFNPYHGFRWLVHDHGHWSFVTMIKDRPVLYPTGGATFRQQSYRKWADATVRVTAVLGEFYWLLEKDETVHATDFIAPPFMLSQEAYPGGSEMIFSQGEYTESKVVREAFHLPGAPYPQGIGAIQPNPWKESSRSAWRWVWVALALLLVEQIGVLGLSSGKPALRDSFGYVEQTGAKTYASQPFTLSGWTRGVTVKTESMINGGSLDLRMRLINEETQKVYPIGQTIARFSGWDADRTSAMSSLTDVPSGRYRLVVEPSNFTKSDPESSILDPVPTFADTIGDAPPVPLTFEVARVADWSPFKLCGFLILLPALFAGARSLLFEGTRWKNSDIGGAAVGSDDD